MMSMEGPFLAAVIARMAEPKFNLAAYGVAFAFALIVEAPIIMIMSASTALVEDRQSFTKLRNFTYLLNGLITVVMLVLLIPAVFDFIAYTLIDLPAEVAELTYHALVILLPWPGAIGYRRFFQGVLIRNNLTRRVAYGTVVRLSTMALTALILYIYFDVDGVIVGASALSIGVCAEALASRLMVDSTVKKIMASGSSKAISYRKIVRFYYPLALTSMLALGAQPLVTFFVGHSRMALESLAVLPVIHSLVFLFRAPGLSYQEAAISLIGEKWENYTRVRNFAAMIGAGVLMILGLIAFTPLASFWFETVSGLSAELSRFAITPLRIVVILPVMTVLLSFQRSVLVRSNFTKPITMATALEVMGIVAGLFVCIKWFDTVGAVAAAIAFITGRSLSNSWLMPPFNKSVAKNLQKFADQRTENTKNIILERE